MSVARLSFAVAAALGSSAASAAGSVVFDNTLPGQAHGTTATVPLSAGHYTIDAANTGYLSNTNLFESFATFIVGAAEEADFTNSSHLQIDNVISRVTGIGAPNGLQPTTIDGKVVSTIAGANFWFVNPAGVAIGSGASINVPAGLAIGTSDFIQFADSSRWYVLESSTPTPSVLSAASPTAFGFLSTPASGALIVRSAQLSSVSGGNLLLSGGAAGVTISNCQLTTSNAMGGAAAGDIDVTSAGQLTIQNSILTSETFTSANAGSIQGSTNRGDTGAISVSSANGLVTILNATLDTQSFSLANSGSIAVSGAGVLVGKQSLLSADYADPGSNDNSGPGTISIRATATVEASDPLQGQLSSATPGVVRIVDSGVTAINSGGAGGNTAGRGQILIGADLPGGSPAITNDVVIAGSFVSTDVSAGGRGNDLTIVGSDAVWIGPSPTGRSLISARTESSAVSGGQILIKGGSGGVSIVSSNVDASNSVDGSNAGATRSPSNITVDSGSNGLVLLSGTVMTTETSGVDKAGDLQITGSSVSITGGSVKAATTGVGNAGNISMTAPGALVLSGTTIDSQSSSTAADAGAVGVINLSGGSVSLSGSTVSALSKGGTAVTSEGGPPGAAITISSTGDSSPFEISGSTITTQAAVTNGSNIVVNAGGSEMLLSNSQVSASATGGNGGNITVTAAGNTVLHGSQIVAQAGPGDGGAINIGLKQGAVFVQDSTSLVSATSRTGNNGTVTIDSPQTDLNSALRVPVVSVAHAPELTANVCRHDSNRSTFVREGRGGVAPDPQGYLSSTTTECP